MTPITFPIWCLGDPAAGGFNKLLNLRTDAGERFIPVFTTRDPADRCVEDLRRFGSRARIEPFALALADARLLLGGATIGERVKVRDVWIDFSFASADRLLLVPIADFLTAADTPR